MATPTQQPVPAPENTVTKVTPLVDLISKITAGAAIAMYGCGFLIVSLHNSRYGFNDTNPIRPRILAAGAWFVLLTSIPASIAAGFAKGYGEKGVVQWRRFLQLLPTLYISCISTSWLLGILFFVFPNVPVAATPNRPVWVTLLIVFGFIVVIGTIIFITESKKVPFIVKAIVSVAVITYLLQDALRRLFESHQFDQSALTLWLFAVATFTIVELKTWQEESPVTKWFKTFIIGLGLLLGFAYYYYPNMKSAWGGGTPVPVTIYLSKDSLINPGQKVSMQLVDETDAGFYVVAPGEDKAIYIPRSSVSLVYFSDKPSGSKLLP